MTKEEIISRARDELADNGVTYYSSVDLFDSYDDAYNEVAVLSGCIERFTKLQLIDNAVYYDLYEAIPNYLRVFAIWNPDVQDWMRQKDTRFFETIRCDWERATGASYHYSVIDFKKIALFPHKTVANGTELEIYYNASPVLPLSLSEVPEFPEQYQICLQYYIIADILAQAEEFTKATMYNSRYVAKVRELTTYLENRSSFDRVNMLRAQFSGGTFYGE